MSEADTCRRHMAPERLSSGWDNAPHRINEQITFADGRIVLAARTVVRRPDKRADFTHLAIPVPVGERHE